MKHMSHRNNRNMETANILTTYKWCNFDLDINTTSLKNAYESKKKNGT